MLRGGSRHDYSGNRHLQFQAGLGAWGVLVLAAHVRPALADTLADERTCLGVLGVLYLLALLTILGPRRRALLTFGQVDRGKSRRRGDTARPPVRAVGGDLPEDPQAERANKALPPLYSVSSQHIWPFPAR